MIKLSKNFTYKEFIHSETADCMDIDNGMNDEQIERAKELCNTILQPIRDYVDKPIRITSGFRCKDLNEIIKGSKHSQHMSGEAAHFNIPGLSVKEICEIIIKLKLPFHQLIDEFSDEGKGWVHVSVAPKGTGPRGQYLKATKNSYGKTVYREIEV